jgi:hypothetical protein
MNDIASKYDYVKKSIPDPQVKDVADQFFDAAKILWDPPLSSGTLIPAIINSVLAIELYLKSLAAYSVIRNLEQYGNGVSGGIVTVEPERSGHKLTNIFDIAEDWVKTAFENKYRESSIFKPNRSFRDCLSTYDEVFVKVRYVYEDSSTLRSVNINELQQLVNLMRVIVESLPRRTTVLK